jgi:colanic acid biosynthesis glycosyl transferase WcaI
MRLVFINRFFHPDESATALMLTDLVQGLAPLGLDMHVITAAAAYTPGASRTAADFPLPEGSVTRLPNLPVSNHSLIGRLLNFAAFYFGLIITGIWRIRRRDIVICLTDPPLVGVLAALLAQLKGAQLIHWVQDIYPETATRLGYGSSSNVAIRLVASLRDWAWKRASINVVIGHRMEDMLREHGVPPRQICIIQNWADDEERTPLAVAKNPLRSQWGFRENHIVVGYSGNLGRAHDAATMLKAAAILAERQNESITMLFIGGGAKHGLLASASADERLAPMIAVRSYRPRSELRQSLSVPDIHWLSLEPELEGLIVPSKFYGAVGVGRPVIFIGDTQGEVALLIKQANCGASFAKGDAQGVADYLLTLAHDDQLRQHLGTNAWQFSRDHLSKARRMQEWRDLIKSLEINHPLLHD